MAAAIKAKSTATFIVRYTITEGKTGSTQNRYANQLERGNWFHQSMSWNTDMGSLAFSSG